MAGRKRDDELVVITKTYDLILWSCNHTSKFPRNHRFVLGERIEQRLYDVLETLIAAKYSRARTTLLQQANLGLEILRFQMRLAGGVVFKPVVHRREAGWGRSGCWSRSL